MNVTKAQDWGTGSMNNELMVLDGNIPIAFTPGRADFKGYDEFKKRMVEINDEYKKIVVTPENLKYAEKKLKQIKDFKTEANKKRISITNQLNQPGKDLKKQVDGLLTITDEAKKNLEDQIDAFKDKEKQERHQKKLVRLQELCKLANVKPEDIEWQKGWDIKSISNKRFDSEVNEQIAMVQQRQDRFAENAQVITQKADELGLPVKHWTDQLSSKSLPVILNEMQDYKDDLTAISAKQKETKVKEAQEMKQAGDTYIDPDTGEIKEKVITLKLEIKGNEWQMNQLKSFLKDNAIEYRGLEG